MPTPTTPGLILAVMALVAAACQPALPPDVAAVEDQLPEIVDYNYHVKPILSDRCFACHGFDENARSAGLRLDMAENAYDELPESPGKYAIVPRNRRKSEVFRRILSEDPDNVMPPPESNLQLSAEEKAILLKWIDQGATYKEHWAFTPPAPVTAPDVSDETWPANDIDRFILARLDREGLGPAEEASKETLIRRLSFDLTGLPPSISDIDDYLADDSPEAYATVVDRLLESEAFGERMAAEWMDVARYADSHGYQDDGMRNMWPWRDWVIGAFNKNIPFDDFLTWQLAGDLLPNATREQILATGFNRNHMQSQEGGIVLEEYRVEYVADRTNTLGTAFMGLTLQCARCHDHKYDPISQKEYFQLFGFFNNVNEIGVIPYAGEASPTVILPDAEAIEALEKLEAEIDVLEKTVAIDHPNYTEGFEEWIETLQRDGASSAWRPVQPIGAYRLDTMSDFQLANRAAGGEAAMVGGDREFPPELVDGKFGKAVRLNGESWIDLRGERYFFERNEPFSMSIWFNVMADSVEGPLIGKSGGLFNGNRGYICYLNEDGTITASINHVGPDNAIAIQTREPIAENTWVHLALTYDGSSRADGMHLYLNGEPVATKTIVDNLQKSIKYTYNFYREEQTNWGGAGLLRLGMIGPNQTRTEDVAFDQVAMFDRELTGLDVAHLYGIPDPLGEALEAASAGMGSHQDVLRAYYTAYAVPARSKKLAALQDLRGQVNEIMTGQQEVMVMGERSEVRPTYMLDRGAYDAPTERVNPGFPEVLPAMAETEPENRLDLAEWLTEPDHPLTARVAVNRYWQMIFGTGLVETPDDFGSQGALPSHPELLDWLAVDFVASGWDVKALLKKMVMSSTYRQSSVASHELRERDPANVLLARAPGHRMTAEMIRDNALAASGLLVPTVGGPSVHPYQPAGLWKELATRNETEYQEDEGDALYRRSMYTVWKRSAPPPAMISFDAAERSFCQVKRQKTNTPLQALVLMNDPQFVEASRLIAERMIREGGNALDKQVVFAFRLLTSRFPMGDEASMLTELYEQEMAHYQEHPDEAGQLLAVGEYPYDVSLEPEQIAAATMVATTIMNFDEAYMKR